MAKGIIYIMTTPIDGIIKIGTTEIKGHKERMRNLTSTGYANVNALQQYFAAEVDNYKEIYQTPDTVLGEYSRTNDLIW